MHKIVKDEVDFSSEEGLPVKCLVLQAFVSPWFLKVDEVRVPSLPTQCTYTNVTQFVAFFLQGRRFLALCFARNKPMMEEIHNTVKNQLPHSNKYAWRRA